MGSWVPFLAFLCAGNPNSLLEKAAQAEPAQARAYLGMVTALLDKDDGLTPSGRVEITQKLAKLLPLKAKTQAEVLEVLGEKTLKTVSRQALFRRYREQWTYERPLRLVVIWDVAKGQEPILSSVTILP